MTKDPAFLFYPGDWIHGTTTFSRLHKGAYMDVLMAQHGNGHLSLEDIKIVLGADFDSTWEKKLKAKFTVDENGLYYNHRLEEVMLKRKAFSESRKKNLSSKKPDMDDHKEALMENRNENRKEKFKKEVYLFTEKYRLPMLDSFFNYWTELNRSKTKMKFELQQTWEMGGRLATWKGKGYDDKKKPTKESSFD